MSKSIFAEVHETIHEHRAPTDSSVRLLDEMQKAAMARVLETVPVKFNEFNGTLIKYKTQFQEDVWAVRFCINGTTYTYEHKMSEFRFNPNQFPEMVADFELGFSQFLAVRLVQRCDLSALIRR